MQSQEEEKKILTKFRRQRLLKVTERAGAAQYILKKGLLYVSRGFRLLLLAAWKLSA
jgi:hypothetical protein